MVLLTDLGRALLREVHARAVVGLSGAVAGATVVGAAAIAGADAILTPNGMAAHLPAVVAAAVVREVVPLGVALALVARTPRADDAEAGAAAGAARVVGGALAGAALVVVLGASALVAGSLTAAALGLAASGASLPALLEPLTAGLIAVALGKGAAFGAAVAAIGWAHRRRARPSSTAAGSAGVVLCAAQGACVCLALDGATLLLNVGG